ncbi:LCP family protein [Salsuginibacillus kocurii]|uniref:LCP family glycopolymer transferase n=1 Tax=Salsuginibacillus kocurii TaxID=427078 RepID=UPI00037D136F|nr:LCP family protein [Salsuginibacillus kocurii]
MDNNESRTVGRRSRQKHRRSRHIWRWFVIIGLTSFIVLGGASAYIVYQIMTVTADNNEPLERGEKSEMREEAVDPGDDSISMLFLGVDSRDGDLSGRTDAMILATFNKEDDSVKMVSIPRDSLVHIPGRDSRDKISHAHAFGGTDLAVETVEQLFDIPVDYYTKMNFTAFIEIIDTLGGIEVDSPLAFTEMDSEDNHDAITIEEGEQVLDGEEALAYARMRKQDPAGDIGRGNRQQDIIEGVIERGTSFSTITQFGSVLDSIDRHMVTNLSFGNLLSLHNYAGSVGEIEQHTLDGTDLRLDYGYYFEIDEGALQELSGTLQNHLQMNEDVQNAEDE